MKKFFHLHPRRAIFLCSALLLIFSLFACVPSACAAENDDPLPGLWGNNTVVEKHRAVITYVNPQWDDTSNMSVRSVKIFRGQGQGVSNDEDLSDYYKREPWKADDVISSRESKYAPFTVLSAAGSIPQTITLSEDFYGSKTYEVKNGVVLNVAFFYNNDDKKEGTLMKVALYNGEEVIGAAELKGLPKPNYEYKGQDHTMNFNTAADMVGFDWNGDGYTDWLLTYVHAEDPEDSYKTKVVRGLIDGKSLYEEIEGRTDTTAISPIVAYNKDLVYGSSNPQYADPQSVRMTAGDIDNDDMHEIAIVWTPAHEENNRLGIYRVLWDGANLGFTELYYADSGIGRNKDRSDSVGIAIGDLDGVTIGDEGTGYKEICVLHALSQKVYLDIYAYTGVKDSPIKKIVAGAEVGKVPATTDNNSVSPLEATIADLDGDGIGELAWLCEDGSRRGTLLLNIHKWEGTLGVNNGIGDVVKSYNLNNEVRFIMHANYRHFSMASGMFSYPGADGLLKKQLAVLNLGNGVTNGELTGVNVNWAIFNWSKVAELTVAGVGSGVGEPLVPNSSYPCPRIIAADLNDEALVLGEPTSFSYTENLTQNAIIKAPPVHYDIISGDFGGTMDASGNSIADAYFSLGGYSTNYSSASGQTVTSRISKDSSFSLGGRAALRKPDPDDPMHPVFDFGVSASANWSQNHSKTEKITLDVAMSVNATHDDQIYYSMTDFTVWRYPVIFPESERYQESRIFNEEGEVVSADVQRFIQVTVPDYDVTPLLPSAGSSVEWYEPNYDRRNLFTYPRELNASYIPGYPFDDLDARMEYIQENLNAPWGSEGNAADYSWNEKSKMTTEDYFNLIDESYYGLVLAKNEGSTIGNPAAASFGATLAKGQTVEEMKSFNLGVGLSGSGAVDLPKELKLDLSVNADYSLTNAYTTTGDVSESNGLTLTWPGMGVSGNYYRNLAGLQMSDLSFGSDMSVYLSEGGGFFTAFTAEISESDNKMWGALTSPYNKYPDPGLLLPDRFDYEGKRDTSFKALKIAGMEFDGGSVHNITSSRGKKLKAIPISTDLYGKFRIFNYSFAEVAANKLGVKVTWQPIDVPKSGEAIDEDRFTIDPTKAITICEDVVKNGIVGREMHLTRDNWVDFAFKWATPAAPQLGLLYVELTYDGTELNGDNNRGYVLMGAYDEEKLPEASRSSGEARDDARATEGFEIVSARVLDMDGNEIANNALPDDEDFVLEAEVKFTSTYPEYTNIPLVNLVLAAEDAQERTYVAGTKTLPFLRSGEMWRARIPYRHHQDFQPTKLSLRVSSPYLVDRSHIAAWSQAYDGGDYIRRGSSGCSAGAPYAAAALLAVVLSMARRRRR